MIDSMKVKRSIYFATLQGYVIFETELYTLPLMKYLVALPPVSNAKYFIATNVKYVKYLKLVDIYNSFLLILP